MELKNFNKLSLVTSISAKALSAIGVIIFQLLLTRLNNEESLGHFSAILSVLFFIGVLARWGSAELLFKDGQSVEMSNGKRHRNIFIFHIMRNTLFRAILLTILLASVNFFLLPLLGLNQLIKTEYYYLWFVAPLFALTSINANYLYLLNKNFIAGLSEPGGVAFLSSLLLVLVVVADTDFDSHLPFLIYGLVLFSISVIPIIALGIITRLAKKNNNQPLFQTQLLQSSIFVYLGQWGTIAVIAAVKPPAIVGIFAVCLQLSVFLDFFMRVAGSVYSHQIRYAYENMPLKDFAKQIQRISRAVALASTAVFIILLSCAEIIFELFGFSDERFYFIFMVLIIARFTNNLFGLTDAFLIMTNYQREYKWIIIVSSSIALGGAFMSPFVKIEIVASMIALTIILRNILSSIVIYKKSGLLMIPLFVRVNKQFN